jgi:hypothetical protein
MENIFRKRAIALTLVMALAMVSLVSLFAVAVPVPDSVDWEVMVEDEAGTMDDIDTYGDMKGYMGEDFMFGIDAQPFIDESDLANVTDNLTAYITIGGMEYMMFFWDLTWLDAGAFWLYTYEADTLGMIAWEINITDGDTNWTVKSGELEVLEAVMFVSAFDDSAEVDEDMTLTWNFTGAFTPSEGLEYDFDWPEGWTVVMVDEMVYNITPPADFYGEVSFAVNASDADYYGYYVHNFTIDVQSVNDAPMLYNILMGDDVYEAEEKNITTEVDDNGTAISWMYKMVIVLPFMEDGGLYNFTVNATDMDSNVSNLEFMIDEDDAKYEIAAWDNMPCMFNFTPAADVNGEIEAMLNISDEEGGYTTMYLWFDIAAENDAPVGAFAANTPATFDAVTGENITVTIEATDIDGDTLTYIWKVAGNPITGQTAAMFDYNWSTPGTYIVIAYINDGSGEIEIGNFTVTVVSSNTAPDAYLAQAYPKGLGALDLIDFLLKNEVEEGTDVELTCTADDAEDDVLTYTWTNDQDTEWTATGAVVTVPGDYFEVGKSYKFTCTVSDGTLEDSVDSNVIKIVEKDSTEFPIGILFGVLGGLVLLVIIIIVVIVVMKGGKKEEEEPELSAEEPVEEEESMEDGMEEPMPEEGEMPMEEPPVPEEGEIPVEETVAPEEIPAEPAVPEEPSPPLQ